ncbi:lipopolysaccharide assembly protein LapA domain-containing protein [Plantactinospora sp. ZYX-F-223]|uniref:lipopolysaccharide assembly protein LapA domain-containing protein n=1 Tax=Plantactinospora sp. ZYX-F-223 TaxID=3144103 RepID=UPI0031FCA76E
MSNHLRTTRGAPIDSATTASPKPSAARSTTRVPHTRTGAAWFGICAAALICVVLIVFMLQNTRSVEVTFLWMQGTLPLALALLIAGVGVAILTMVVGAARITQLRRLSRRQRH